MIKTTTRKRKTPRAIRGSLSVLLCLLMVFGCFIGIPVAGAADIVASGECGAEGDNLTWTLNSDGLLTISGSGRMQNYSSIYTTNGTRAPWFEWKDDILALTMSTDITSIGNAAFQCCTNLTGPLAIPDGVTSIGDCAFLEDASLSGELSFPTVLTAIGSNAFSGCSSLTGALNIPNTVTAIGASAFMNCAGLTSLTLPEQLTSIADNAFTGCSGFTGTLNLPATLTSIGTGAFVRCSGFTGDLTIPNSVESIGATAFFNCSGFDGELALSSSLTSIGSHAFYNCSGLTGALTIPSGVTSIPGGAFNSCSSLTGPLTIPDGVTEIGDSAFAYDEGITGSLVLPDSVTTISASAFNSCSGFTGTLVLPSGITALNNKTFYSCRGLEAVSIPDTITTVGTDVFDYCYNLVIECSEDSAVYAKCQEENYVLLADRTNSTTGPYYGPASAAPGVDFESMEITLGGLALVYTRDTSAQGRDCNGFIPSLAGITISDNGTDLVYGTDYTWEYVMVQESYKPQIKIIGLGDYAGGELVVDVVTTKDISACVDFEVGEPQIINGVTYLPLIAHYHEDENTVYDAAEVLTQTAYGVERSIPDFDWSAEDYSVYFPTTTDPGTHTGSVTLNYNETNVTPIPVEFQYTIPSDNRFASANITGGEWVVTRPEAPVVGETTEDGIRLAGFAVDVYDTLGNLLTEGEDYTVVFAYDNNGYLMINADVNIMGIGEYEGSSFNIDKPPLPINMSAQGEVVAIPTQYYTGNPVEPTVSVRVYNEDLPDGSVVLPLTYESFDAIGFFVDGNENTCSVWYTNNSAPGTATAHFRVATIGTDSMYFEGSAQFEILAQPRFTVTTATPGSAFSVRGSDTSAYNPDDIILYNDYWFAVQTTAPTFTVKNADGDVLTEGTDYVVSTLTNVYDDGYRAQMTMIQGIGDYAVYADFSDSTHHFAYLDISDTVTIAGNAAVDAAIPSVPFGTAISDIQATLWAMSTAGNTFLGWFPAGTFADLASLPESIFSVTLEPNQPGTAVLTLTINPSAVPNGDVETYFSKTASVYLTGSMDNVTANAGISKQHTGEAITLTAEDLGLVDNGYELTEGTDYTINYSDNVAVGTATATITGIGPYAGSTKTVEFEIYTASIDASDAVVTLDPISPAFDPVTNTVPSPGVMVTLGGETLTENEDYTASVLINDGKTAGTVTVTFIGNYTGEPIVAPFTVTPAHIDSADITADFPANIIAGGDLDPSSVTVYINGEELAADYYDISIESTNAPKGQAVVALKAPYEGEAALEFDVVPTDVSDSAVVAEIGKQVYTGSPVTPEITVTVDGKPLAEGSDYTVVCSDNTERGTATATITFIGNYTGTTTATFEIVDDEYEIRNAKAPSCTEPGYTGDKYSIYTGNLIEEGTAIEPEGHAYVEKIVSPSCTRDGYVKYVCERCGDSYVDSVIEATGHTDINGDGRCDTCGHQAASIFRCGFCDKYEQMRGIPFVGFIVTIVHFFVHFAQMISWLT